MRTLLAIAAAAFLAAPTQAQGWIEPLPNRPGGFGVVKVRTAVSATVVGRVAHVEVEEWFRNDGGGLGEGDYLYPLPAGAVFSNFSLFQGDEELRGETMDAARARAIYEEIVRRQRDPALIELAGHGLVRARVFPIGAGETRKITLRYTQVLERAGDALHFRYAAGGRYDPGITRVDGTRRPERRPERAPLTFRLVADSGEAYGDPFSPTHPLRIRRDDGRLVVQPETELFGDVALFLPLRRALVGITLVAHRPVGEDGYFMLTLSPGRADGEAVPRDVTVVLDVSGSMSGSKLTQAKAALHQLLGSLGERDRFRLLAFSNAVRAYTDEWATPRAAGLRDARTWIDALQADGGTNIAAALAEAFRLPTPDGRLPIVVFLTDGLPSVGEENPERIALQAETERGRARVFAFGVGHDVNTYLLDRLSAAGRGSTQYVEPGEDVEQALSLLAAKIQHPVLADLAIADAPVELVEVYPRTLPDLFQGEELVVFGRYRVEREARDGQLRVTGRRNGRTERFASAVTFPARQDQNDFIPRLWASRKLGFLTQQLRLEGHSEALVEEIRETALRYGLLSEYTSYLVQEPTAVAGGVRGRPLDQVMAQPAAAPPSAAFGAGAVQAAEQSRARREARSMAELDAVNEAMLERGHFGQTRHVAGRLFREVEGVWTDVRHADSLRTVAVEPYSEAYFALLQALPELEPYVTEFEQVVVTGAAASVRVADGGVATLGSAELTRLVREFRHR